MTTGHLVRHLSWLGFDCKILMIANCDEARNQKNCKVSLSILLSYGRGSTIAIFRIAIWLDKPKMQSLNYTKTHPTVHLKIWHFSCWQQTDRQICIQTDYFTPCVCAWPWIQAFVSKHMASQSKTTLKIYLLRWLKCNYPFITAWGYTKFNIKPGRCQKLKL